MLAYAPTRDRQKFRPAALTVIIAVHAALLAALMAAKMDLPSLVRDPPIVVDLIDPPKPPPEPRPAPHPDTRSQLDRPAPRVPVPLPAPDPLPMPQPMPLPGPPLGGGAGAGTGTLPLPDPAPLVRTGPRFATPADRIRPPYPEAKLASGDEAKLRLRLTIDPRGRVVAVDPVGAADPLFLAAARRHILRAWRYEPATEGGAAIGSTTTITLEFRLDS
jgi:protein TonB